LYVLPCLARCERMEGRKGIRQRNKGRRGKGSEGRKEG